jgi:hypothetical protein
VLRISVPKREEVVGEWRRLHNEELQNLYTSPKSIMVIQIKGEMGRTCSMQRRYEKFIQNFDHKT